MIHSNVLELVGTTPIVELNRIGAGNAPSPRVRLLAKVESKNIGGSIKDRVALAMIEAAEAEGRLTPGKVVIEATSGNTGIGLAMVCAVKGYPLKLIMPESASEERKRIMRAYGAELVLTPGRLATDGAIEEAYRLAREEPETYVLVDQYNNPASIAAHYRGTGREIWQQTDGVVTHVVATLGTTGTAMGIATFMREHAPHVEVVAVEPYAGHRIQGLKNMQESYPPGIWDKRGVSRVIRVEDEEAFECSRRLAREEGLLVGMSAGAALAGALRVAKEISQGVVVFICPDSGERYLSTNLFAPPEKEGLRLHDLALGTKTLVGGDKTEAGLFTPGPSLDASGELDAWRRVVLLDTAARYLGEKGRHARLCVGLADMDDRSLAAAREARLSRAEFARQAAEEVRGLAARLGVHPQAVFATASESLETMLVLTKRLLGRGLAYEKLRSVYFDVTREARYGQTSGEDMTGLQLGRTVDLSDYVKDNPQDFTLLKRASLQDLKLGDVVETEWGNVRPSWFLQHAAAALDHLDAPAVMLAGEAHRFPHLENFRAIWSRGAGAEVRIWALAQPVHPAELEEGDAEPAALPDLASLLSQWDGRTVRLWLLSTSYRKPLAFSPEALAMWAANARKLQELYVHLRLRAGEGGAPRADTAQAVYDLKKAFAASMEDDLALHRFWPELFSFVRSVNSLLAENGLSEVGAKAALKELRAVDRVLGILDHERLPLPRSAWPPDVAELVERREEARTHKNFALADELRETLAEAGYRVEDAPRATLLYRG